jgi:hypothetical protein
MDPDQEDLYDEFGNYIGPDPDDDDEEEEDDDDALESAFRGGASAMEEVSLSVLPASVRVWICAYGRIWMICAYGSMCRCRSVSMRRQNAWNGLEQRPHVGGC